MAQKKKINLSFTYSETYCGGARPTEEIEKESQIAKPYSNKTIVWVNDRGKIDSAATDKDGILKLKLRKGKYKVYEAWHYYLYTPDDIPINSFDRECLKLEWEKQIYTLVVTRKEARAIAVNKIIKYCPWSAPCLLQQETPPSRQ